MSNDTITNPDPVILYGSGRSGTTWLEERIAGAILADVIFEPLHPEVNPVANKYAYRFIKPGDNAADLLHYIKQLLAGEVDSLWTRYRVLPSRLIPKYKTFTVKAELKSWLKRYLDLYRNYRIYRPNKAKSRKVIKLIRGNLLLPWLLSEMSDAVHIAIVRHPISVIESRMRLDLLAGNIGLIQGSNDWNAQRLINMYLQHGLPEELAAICSALPDLDTLSELEQHCVLWCIENKLLLSTAHPSLIIAKYEQLLVADSDAWKTIANKLAVDYKQLVENIKDPSQQTAKTGTTNSGASVAGSATKLKKLAGNDCCSIIQLYLDTFSIDSYTAIDNKEGNSLHQGVLRGA